MNTDITRYPMKEDGADRCTDLYRFMAAHYGDQTPFEAWQTISQDLEFLLMVMTFAEEGEETIH